MHIIVDCCMMLRARLSAASDVYLGLPEPEWQYSTRSICTWRPRRSSSLWMVTEDTQRLSPPCSALPMDSIPTMSMQN